ncbi:hypothetical protein GTA08_BOTSDO01708 [Neofusicoccum parvum]|nr:hypothetical protein GTA08_BOTSDO01708 [Neofusicoccum parvum]
MMYRRFGWIQSRLLLDKQNELVHLEKELEAQDGFASEYDLTNADLLATGRNMMGMRRPTASEYESLRNYCNYAQTMSEIDETWTLCKEDLVTLRPGREYAWLDTAIEKALRICKCDLLKYIFCSKETREKSNGPEVYYTRSRIEGLAAAIITFMILVLLVVPTYVLYHLTNDADQNSHTTALCIGVLLVFTLAFSAVLSLFTRARRHEILAAAAA